MLPPGTAPVKPEYLISHEVKEFDDDAAEGTTNPINPDYQDALAAEGSSEPPTKKPRLSGSQKRKLAKEEGKNTRGQNKGRRFKKLHDEIDLCWTAARGGQCDKTDCKFSHDIKGYLNSKPDDIRFPRSEDLVTSPPFVLNEAQQAAGNAESEDTICPVFREAGECRQGFKCRFFSGHRRIVQQHDETDLGVELIRDNDKAARVRKDVEEQNRLTNPSLMKLLRTRKYPTPKSDPYLAHLVTLRDDAQEEAARDNDAVAKETATEGTTKGPEASNGRPSGTVEVSVGPSTGTGGIGSDGSDVPFRPVEKKRLQWKGLTYLAPLTTVGNLPFRRLCVRYGADITCGEMGLAASYLNASREEWSLVRRHPSESMFGVQLAGNKPATMVPAAEVISQECPNIDFVDVNCGCPIDLVYKNGAGSALLDTPNKLGKIVLGMNRVLGDIPVTVKLRTGVKEGRNIAHRLMPRLQEWGVGAVTIHGRTRQQRYTKLADWNYIKQCAETLRSSASDDLPYIPIFGGGDAFSSQGYWECLEGSGVDGIMVARGALIKPWIFTEIKERREWDISSRERLDMIRQLCEFGLNHWGSDTAGVNTTRRYVCESMSFLHRYIPIGLLERLPGRMNERAPAFRGRDELETLLASADSKKWVEISSMFLGAPPENWEFQPKHRSNSVSDEGNG